MFLKHALFYIALVTLTIGCVALPTVEENTEDHSTSSCKLLTKKLTLKTHQLPQNMQNIGSDPRLMIPFIAVGGSIYAISSIVSGTIMLTANAVHWIEKKGTCGDDSIQEANKTLSSSLATLGGGKSVSSTQDIVNFFDKKQETLEHPKN